MSFKFQVSSFEFRIRCALRTIPRFPRRLADQLGQCLLIFVEVLGIYIHGM